MKNDQIKEWLESEKGRKIILASFLFLSLGTVIYGVASLRAKMQEPFGGKKTGWAVYTEQKQAEEIARLQATDTDGDGLSDYDEKFIYGTSLYVADTDSDGLLDGVEIKNNTDPLCAEGKDCSLAIIDNTQSVTTVKAMTPAEIRAALLAAGISQDLLTGVDDATLQQIYEETIGTQATSSETQATMTASGHTATEIRTFFKTSGMDEATLSAISDADLLTSYQNTITSLGYDPIKLSNENVLASYLASGTTSTETTIENSTTSTNKTYSTQDLLDIRKYLVDNGIAQSEIDALTDAELIQIINTADSSNL